LVRSANGGVLIAYVDGLKGFPETIESIFAQSRVQSVYFLDRARPKPDHLQNPNQF